AGRGGGEGQSDRDRVTPDEAAGALERRVLPRGDEPAAREPLEILGQLEGGRIAAFGIDRDRLGDDRQQIWRQARLQQAEGDQLSGRGGRLAGWARGRRLRGRPGQDEVED